MSLRYGYSCARCGVRHEFEAPAKTLVGPLFVCDGCMVDSRDAEGRTADSYDSAQLALFLADNPTTHPGHRK